MFNMIGWLLIPYVMLPFRWKKMSFAKRMIALVWIAAIAFAVIGRTGTETGSLPSAETSRGLPEQSAAQSDREAQAVPRQAPTADSQTKPNDAEETPAAPTEANTAAGSASNTANRGDYDTVIHFPVSQYPQTAAHIQSAIQKGESPICTIDRKGAEENREESLAGIPTKTGYDRDEWPMAMCTEGGADADIAYIAPADNRGAGSWVGNHLEHFPNGTRVLFVIDGGKSEAVASVVRSETESGVDSQAATPAAAEHQTSPAKSVNANPQTVQQTTPVVYKNCSAVRAAGAAPLRAGEPGYSRKLDRDGDGIACE